MAQLITPSTLLLCFLLLRIHCSSSSTTAAVFDITAFGAKSDGQTNSAPSFAKAWTTACSSPGPATVYVPAGSFTLGPVAFSGPCSSSRITVQIDGTLIAPSNYAEFSAKGNWILFDHIDGVSVHGGVIDGRGASLWSCKSSGHNCPDGANLMQSLTFLNSKNVMISGLSSINSELYHIVIDGCEGVTVQAVKISAPGNSPNTDGVHVQMSTDVTVTGTGIKTGDDCISIGPGTTNSDIQGSSATQVAVNFDCSSSNPCTGIGLQDIKLTYESEPAQSSCKHADGSVTGVVEPPSCLCWLERGALALEVVVLILMFFPISLFCYCTALIQRLEVE